MRLLHLTFLWLLGIMQVSAALEVRNPRWGFGGKPVLGTFNILSVEVRNTGNSLANAELKLTSETDGASAAPYVFPVSLTPGQSRWVQFNVYVGNYKPDFNLAWGSRRDESVTFEDVPGEKKHASPAVVVLADPENVRTARFPVFPEEIFPVSVSATDGLHAVLLDHQPRFRVTTQTDAFLDWVQLGGIVHLLPGPGGTLPAFEGKFAVLNGSAPIRRVGAGWVVTHPFPVGDATSGKLEAAGFSMPGEAPPPDFDSERFGRYGSDGATDSSFFETLAMVTRPKISWWLIYLLTGIYVVIIGPVFFLLRKRDYRLLLVGFVCTVALFAWLFTAIGRRGYGERQVCHSLAVARVLGGGRYDVAHWSHAFATSGNTYHFAYPGASQLYAAIGQGGEKVRGSVHLGGDSFFEADIPLFSFRNFMHRGVMAGDDISATIVSAPKTDPTRSFDQWRDGFEARLAGDVPGEVITAAIQVGSYYLPAKIEGRKVTVRGYSSNSGVEVLRGPGSNNNNDNYNYRYYRYGGGADAALAELRGDGANLAQRALGDNPSSGKQRGFGRAPGKETLRLYIYTVAPRAFRLVDSEFATDKNFVLYVQDLAIPAASSSL
jgi:hypothetical protein